MSVGPRPPGGPSLPASVGGLSPPSPGTSNGPGGGAAPGALRMPSPPGTSGAPAWNAPLDGPAALRVFVEEVRAAVEARLAPALRGAAMPVEDPGNAAAALLRALRAAIDEGGLPPAAVREFVEAAHARTLDAVRRAAAESVRTGGSRPDEPPGPAAPSARPTPPGAPSVAADAGTVEAVRIALATARDVTLRGLDAALRTAPAVLARAPETPPPGRDGAASAGAPRAAPPTDAIAVLRGLVDAVRAELVRAIGPARLPAAPPPLVTDPSGAALGPAIVRWLQGAVAERGVPLAVLRDAVRAAFARIERASSDDPGPTATKATPLRDVLAGLREQVLRGLGAPDDRAATRAEVARPDAVRADAARLDALRLDAARPDAPRPDAMREAVRTDAPADPRGVALAGLPVPRDERVAAVDPRDRARRDDPETAGGDVVPATSEPRADDLQGPLDCVRRYFEAAQADDSARYAEQWVYPACFWSGGRWSSYPTAVACAAGNDAHRRELQAQGVAGGRILLLRAEPLTVDVAIVHGTFTREGADGRVLAEVEAAYTTVRTEAGWRVAVCVLK